MSNRMSAWSSPRRDRTAKDAPVATTPKQQPCQVANLQKKSFLQISKLLKILLCKKQLTKIVKKKTQLKKKQTCSSWFIIVGKQSFHQTEMRVSKLGKFTKRHWWLSFEGMPIYGFQPLSMTHINFLVIFRQPNMKHVRPSSDHLPRLGGNNSNMLKTTLPHKISNLILAAQSSLLVPNSFLQSLDHFPNLNLHLGGRFRYCTYIAQIKIPHMFQFSGTKHHSRRFRCW